MYLSSPSVLPPAFLIFMVSAVASMTTLDYCLLSCDGINHTMCDYLSGGGPECEDFQSGLSEDEERLILDLHNRLRQRVATGAESQDQPPASDMLEVIWDKEAAIIAQRWADQCDLLGHDRCRRTLHEAHVGQNIAWMKGVDFPGRVKSREDVLEYFISGWFKEVENFNGEVDSFNPTDQEFPKFGHYTQLVWASTGEIGCGFVQWVTDIEYEYKLVCNYVPGGNVRGERVYERGEPCSECPLFSKCSEKWPGLCEADDWSLHGDFKVSNRSDKGEPPLKDVPPDKDEEPENVENTVEDSVSETINNSKSEETSFEKENEPRKGHGHALKSFLFVTVFTVLLNCYLFKIATVN